MAALAHGCAIITTTPRVALPELMDGTNVLLTPPDDVPALAQAIERLIRDEALRRRLQAGAAQLSQRFRWDAIADQTVRLFERIVSGAPAD
jgi:glycosyltransferase involved in cell wall biosynthesis